MFQFKTNIPRFDKENAILLKAARLLESLGNSPDMLASEFYQLLADRDIDMASEEFVNLTGAAIAIETMLRFEQIDDLAAEPTIN